MVIENRTGQMGRSQSSIGSPGYILLDKPRSPDVLICMVAEIREEEEDEAIDRDASSFTSQKQFENGRAFASVP